MSQGGRQRKGRSLRHRSAFSRIRSAILERSSQVTTGKCPWYLFSFRIARWNVLNERWEQAALQSRWYGDLILVKQSAEFVWPTTLLQVGFGCPCCTPALRLLYTLPPYLYPYTVQIEDKRILPLGLRLKLEYEYREHWEFKNVFVWRCLCGGQTTACENVGPGGGTQDPGLDDKPLVQSPHQPDPFYCYGETEKWVGDIYLSYARFKSLLSY